jgi:phosphatidylserine/phosphatidylglycerophosphate/cardiolipin synthase-like enzyme
VAFISLRSRLWRAPAAAAAVLLVAVAVTIWLMRPDPVLDVSDRSAGPAITTIHFGGPGRPDNALRNLLLEKIRATPPQQSIDWATYYFLDAELAQALIAASRRGVRVRLVVEGDPRMETVNGPVIAMLKRDGLNGGLTIRPEAPFPFESISGKLHAKIYAFSWPRPVALVGSFNPSGGTGDDAAPILQEIGDQDRGHNLLAEVASPGLVAALVHHVAELARGGGQVGRLSNENRQVVRDRDTQLYFYPRVHNRIVERELDRLGPGDRLWAAVSHLKGGGVGALEDAARRGAKIELIVHNTERRVPQHAVDRLRKAGINIRRYRHPQAYPMHDKFFVFAKGSRLVTYFGSLNFNRNSRFFNDEVLIRSTNKELALTLLKRFAEIDREIKGQYAASIVG